MCILWPSKVQGVDGKPCQGIGAKTGRVIPTLMDRVSPFWSPQVMVAVSSHTMLHHQVGPLDKPTLEGNSSTNQPFTWNITLIMLATTTNIVIRMHQRENDYGIVQQCKCVNIEPQNSVV